MGCRRYRNDIEKLGGWNIGIMRDNVLWRKQARIIMALASALEVDEEKALDIFYSTETYKQLSNAKYGLQLMSDGYVLENVLRELRVSV